MMNFVAIDFETATSARNSACSVAVVEVKDGVVCDSYYTLIKPPGMKFTPFNITIHGIRPEMVKNERTFPEVWDELAERLENKLVVAHNAPFDMSVLKYSLLENHLALPRFQHCCTVKIARKVWPQLVNHKLDTVGRYLNYDFHHHHALDDAKACAAIPLQAAKELGAESLPELMHKLGLRIQNFG